MEIPSHSSCSSQRVAPQRRRKNFQEWFGIQQAIRRSVDQKINSLARHIRTRGFKARLVDEELVEAFMFLTRMELNIVQLVNRRLRQLVKGDAITTKGPYHRLHSLSIADEDNYWDLGNAPWGNGKKPPNMKLSLKDRLFLLRYVKRFSSFIEVFVDNNRYDSDFDRYPTNRFACFVATCVFVIGDYYDGWRNGLHKRYVATLTEAEPVHTSALQLMIKDVCRCPLPPYIRVEKLRICIRGRHHPFANDLRQWLYNSREAFTDVSLELDVDKYRDAPWMLGNVFTQPSHLRSYSFGHPKLAPSLQHCPSICIWISRPMARGQILNVDSVFEWLHYHLPMSKAKGGGGGTRELRRLQIVVLEDEGWKLTNYDWRCAIEELLSRIKEAFLVDSGKDFSRVAPTFLISIDFTTQHSKPWQFDSLELHKGTVTEKLGMKMVYEDNQVPTNGTCQRLYGVYRCHEEAEESIMALMGQLVPAYHSRNMI